MSDRRPPIPVRTQGKCKSFSKWLGKYDFFYHLICKTGCSKSQNVNYSNITTDCLGFGLCSYNKGHLKTIDIEKWS